MKRTIRTASMTLVPLALLAAIGAIALRTTVTAQDDRPQPGDKLSSWSH